MFGSDSVVADGSGLPRHTLRLGILEHWPLVACTVDGWGKKGRRRSQRSGLQERRRMPSEMSLDLVRLKSPTVVVVVMVVGETGDPVLSR